MNKKRVLMLATTAAMIEQFNKENIKILNDMGYSVDMIGNFKKGNPISDEKLDSFKEWIRDRGGIAYDYSATRNPFDFINNGKALVTTIKLIRENNYSFVHCHTPIGSIIGRMACLITRTKVIYTAHGFHFFKGAPLKNWILYYPVEKFFSRFTDVLITINKEDYERALKKFHAKKTIYIPGVGVDTKKFSICKIDKREKKFELGIENYNFVFLSVGELSDRKNQKIFIEALGKMKENNELGNIVYLVVGKGEKYNELETLSLKYDIKNNVKFLGFRTDIDELCEIADCFVHTSIREGLGIAPLEAMACGLPLISSNINGIKDYTENNYSGCCIDPYDVATVIEAIKKMVDDKSFRENCGFNNLKTVQQFDISKTNIIMNEIYGGYKHLLSIVVRQAKRKEFGIKYSDYVITSSGELNDNKNHQMIIKSLPNNKNIKYVIAGKGNRELYLKQLSIHEKKENQVLFVGYRDDIKEILWMSDCFAFPSKREGLGLSAIEALAAGLPIIGNNIGGIKEYCINNVTGWLCSNIEDYKAAIIKSMNKTWNKNTIHGFAYKYDVRITDRIMKSVYENINY